MNSVIFALTLALALNAIAGPAAAPASLAIRDAADLDNYLAGVAPGQSPFDRLSPQARARFIEDFRKGIFLVPDELEAELTHDETLAILVLFGVDEVPSAMTLRPTHSAIGATETPEVTASFAALRAAYTGPNPRDPTLAEYRRTFARRQSEGKLRAMSDGDVALFQRAALMVATVAPGDPHDALMDLAEAERRDIAAPAWIRKIHNQLVLSRDFAAAEGFRKQHSNAGLPALPPMRDERHGDGPSVLEIASDGDVLVRRTVSIDRPAQVIVIAGCHFSKDAVHSIEADPELRALFARDVMWVTPAEWNPADPDLIQWNRDHPLASMSTVWRESEWQIDMSAMPTFYFLRGGHVEARVVGWQPDQVRDGFRKVGLSP